MYIDQSAGPANHVANFSPPMSKPPLHRSQSFLLGASWGIRAVVLGLLCLVATGSIARADDGGGMVIAGNARFTVVTPDLIRMEYAPDGKFVDAPSWYAVNRQARFAGATVHRDGDNSVDIDTGEIQLHYRNDGQPFSPRNLSADIRKGGENVTWTPGTPSAGNLGGTIQTLDGVHGPVPLGEGIVSRDGWYLLDDSHSDLFTGDWISERPKNGGVDWYLFGYGLDFKAALRSLTAAGGPIPLPRRYTMGTWYSRFWGYSADEFKQIVDEYQQHHVPLDVLVMDMDWHIVDLNQGGPKKLIWSGYTWNKQLIPDPVGLLRWMHDRGVAVTLNDHPADGIQPWDEMYPAYMTAMGVDPALKKQIPFDAGNKHFLDVFYDYSHVPREKDGADFWWLDWQQFPRTVSLPSLENRAVLNYYYYTRTSSDNKRGQSFGRWAGWGDHRYPIEFSGDSFTNWETLAFEVPFTSTAGNVGCFFWSHDIGGHQGGRNEESYTRWCQFGAFTAALRSHSMRDPNTDRRPWKYPDWAQDSMIRSFQLRAAMMPYVYSAAWAATRDTIPFIRPMYLDYPDQEEAYHNGQQYLFGDNLLVAPVVHPGVGPDRIGWEPVWFPGGEWYDFFTGEKFSGTGYAVAAAGINSFPLFVQAGIPLPMRPYDDHPAMAPLTQLIMRCYPGMDGREGSFTLYEDDGLSQDYQKNGGATTLLHYLRQGDTVTVTIDPVHGAYVGQPQTRSYVVDLPCTEKLSSCDRRDAVCTYDVATFTNRIELPALSIHDPVKLTLHLAETDPERIRQIAVADRVAALLGQPIAQWRTQNPHPSPEMAAALAAAQGNALVAKFTHPYFLGGDQEIIYCHNHSDHPDTVSWAVGDGAERPDQFVPGEALPLGSRSGGKLLPGTGGMNVPQSVHAALPSEGGPLDVTLALPYHLDEKADLALSATLSSSSGDPRPAADGQAIGYPQDRTKEWISQGQKEGAWIELDWTQPVQAGRVLLWDRPNPNDQILAGRLEFDDGTTIDVGELPNDGQAPCEISFPSRKVSRIKFIVTRVSPQTENIGLAEIAVTAD